MSTQYSIIVPVFNEEGVIYTTYRCLKQVMEQIGEAYELLFVNDGSRDNTAFLLNSYSEWDETVKLINFSRHYGHQIAITAGMDYAVGEAVVIIDSNMQSSSIELIPDMIAKWKEGFDVVYMKRAAQKEATLLKKQIAGLFSRILRTSTDSIIALDSSEFRLLDRKVYEELRQFSGKNHLLDGMVSWVGYSQTIIVDEQGEQVAEKPQLPFKKLLKLCLNVITSYSFKPLKIVGYLGGVLSSVGLLYLGAFVYFKLFIDAALPMWHSLAAFQLFSTGFILMIMGILGVYIGRIYAVAKSRPLYMVRDSSGVAIKESRMKGVS
ncbi:glycosyltransferase family 2 protein [Paenibacillus radicis (ex Xue et al. 2023)]|uniref:Glycosyltransferase family 2 protein n=1 Tax=Paenibacillus radicis (ex Xue et al. 2023) TaxID=2972489 RepID=A0ABT1YCH6_9BACL|nr:glycosyltransferase family 2 protein [Paenibacillus radicis (ex Xue et al. 2023)]MCR8630901.1 glycosyltransferase family 2 protein [Paenibacillus radicis (ex Xue et al. 2023)]